MSQDIHQAHILIVDDNEDNRYTLRRRLSKEGYGNISEVEDGQMALDHLVGNPVDLMLLDLMMPVVDGFGVLEVLREDPVHRLLPVIMISADEGIENVVRGIELGAVDYLSKPFNPSLLRARVKAALENKHLREVEKAYQELFDEDTGLSSRKHFLSQVQSILGFVDKDRGSYAIFSVSIPTIKELDSSRGTLAAVALVKSAARALKDAACDSCVLARTGESGFAFFTYGHDSEMELLSLSRTLHEKLTAPVDIEGHIVSSKVNVGVALSMSEYDVASDMLSDADLAVSKSVQNGEADIKIFDPKMQAKADRDIQIQAEMRVAIDEGQFKLYYQPLLDLKTGKITGAEALIRWIHPEKGMISPLDFITVAEESGLILPIGSWVIHEGCRQLAEWVRGYGEDFDFVLNVNVSPRQFMQQDVVAEFREAFDLYGKVKIKAELTESTMMHDEARSLRILKELMNIDVQRAMDDFGTGYSSLGSLNTFPFNTVKMDKTFVDRIQDDNASREIVKAVIIMAHAMGMNVVAEGVETAEDMALLREWNCDIVQGYFVSRPLPAGEFKALFDEGRSW